MQVESNRIQSSLPHQESQEKTKIIQNVRRYGSSASDAILDPACCIFTLPNINGLIGYRIETSCAVVYGDPLCDPQDLEQLVCAFHELCQEKGLKVIYITTSEQFANWSLKHGSKIIIEFGEELIIDPHDNPKDRTGVNASLVRRKVRHAQKEGAVVAEYLPYDQGIEKEIENVGTEWLKSRQGPQIHTSNIHIFDNRPGKRWFYASKNGVIVGVVVLHQLLKKSGWLLNHLMHTPDAPHGTPELLLTAALEAVAKEGSHYVTFGSVPGSRLGKVVGLNKISQLCIRQLFWIAGRIFHLEGRKKFWGKFHPASKSSYLDLVFGSGGIGWREIKALMSALNVSIS